jgi:hypothetical protein
MLIQGFTRFDALPEGLRSSVLGLNAGSENS